MDVRTLARTPAVACTEDATVAEVAVLMRDSGVGSVVVTDEHGHLTGIVTDRDLVVRCIAEGLSTEAGVARVATADPVHVLADQDATEAATRMVEHGCRRLPVLDEDGTVVGVVALDDLLQAQAFAHQLDRLSDTLDQAGMRGR